MIFRYQWGRRPSGPGRPPCRQCGGQPQWDKAQGCLCYRRMGQTPHSVCSSRCASECRHRRSGKVGTNRCL